MKKLPAKILCGNPPPRRVPARTMPVLRLVTNYLRGWGARDVCDNDDLVELFSHHGAADAMTYSELIEPDSLVKPHVDVDIAGADLDALLGETPSGFSDLANKVKLQWVDRLAALFKIDRSQVAISSRHRPPCPEGGKISFHMVVNTVKCEARVLHALMQPLSDLPGFDPNIYKLDKRRVFTCVECYKPLKQGGRNTMKMTRESHRTCLRRHFVNYVDGIEHEDATDLSPEAATKAAEGARPAAAPLPSFAITDCAAGQPGSLRMRVVSSHLSALLDPLLMRWLLRGKDISSEDHGALRALPGSAEVPASVAALLQATEHRSLTIVIGTAECRVVWWGEQGGVAMPRTCLLQCDECKNDLTRLNDEFESEPCPCVATRKFYYFWLPAAPAKEAAATADDQVLALQGEYFGGEEAFTRRLRARTGATD